MFVNCELSGCPRYHQFIGNVSCSAASFQKTIFQPLKLIDSPFLEQVWIPPSSNNGRGKGHTAGVAWQYWSIFPSHLGKVGIPPFLIGLPCLFFAAGFREQSHVFTVESHRVRMLLYPLAEDGLSFRSLVNGSQPSVFYACSAAFQSFIAV